MKVTDVFRVITFWSIIYIGSLIFCGVISSGCKPPRLFNMSSSPSKSHWSESREIVNEREYYVRNGWFCPAYYDYEDWGIVVLAVADVTDREVVFRPSNEVVDWKTKFQPYRIAGTNTSKQSVDICVIGKTVTCQYEKDVVIVCYNDESGNCYSTRLEMDDPRVACLFYGSGHKKRTEIIDLWYQLNEKKDEHTIIFEAPTGK